MVDRRGSSLLLLACTFPTLVLGQEVTPSLVSTHYLEVTWTKDLQWMGVDEYRVNFAPEGSTDCIKTVQCPDITCTFNSTLCGFVLPCSSTTITVTGDEYSAPTLSLVTGPEKVTNFSAYLINGTEYISWANPSMDSSPCYNNTVVRVSFNNEDSISYFSHAVENTSKFLCTMGYGEVEVWTQGGDGRSDSLRETIIYNGSSVIDLVTADTCEPVGCTGLAGSWSYNPACPEVEYLSVSVGNLWQNVSTDARNLTVTGLIVDYEYSLCVYARRKDGAILDTSCAYDCHTAYDVPQNLSAKPLSSSSINITWEPPVCHREPMDDYVLWIGHNLYTTKATHLVVEHLTSFYRYDILLQVGIETHSEEDRLTTTEYTLPNTPSLDGVYTNEDDVFLSWSFDVLVTWGFQFRFIVTWGEHLQYMEDTEETSLMITGFNITDEVFKVCVAAYPVGREDLMSNTDCRHITLVPHASKSSMNAWAITGIVLGVLAAVALGGFVVFMFSKRQRDRQRQQRQQ